ncbi:MAG: hypothetical protein GWP17_00200, partial [Aquificales bacterium]|nr:hypothetical protein [Aquificales bacterium]
MKQIVSLKRVLLLAALVIITVTLQTAVAQDEPIPPPEPLSIPAPASSELIIIATETDNPPEPVLAPAISRSPNAVKTANIQVNYIDKATTWDTATGAEAAFQYAVDIWATLVASPVTIVVDAYWIDLSYIDSGILGAASATDVHANNNSFPYANTLYPAALADALAGSDLNGGTAEIRSYFNSSYANWYFGTTNTTPSTQWNFASVVLHEIGHGLGFFGSMHYDDGQADRIECRGIRGEGCWGYSSCKAKCIAPAFPARIAMIRILQRFAPPA